MKIKVSASYSGKLPVAAFSNVNPGFYAEEEFEIAEPEKASELIDMAQKVLHGICLRNFQMVAEQAKVDKIKSDMKDFRFYKTEWGEFPSVTTILDPEFKAWVGEDELRIATSEGTIQHARAAHFIETGKWVDPKELEGIVQDLMICEGRFLDTWNFPAFLEKYPMKDMRNGKQLVNKEYRYAGTNDGECLYPLGGAKDGELVPTIFDFKRTPSKEKNFCQMSAYSKCAGMEHIKQMMIIPTNSDTAQGFSKPILSTHIDEFFEIFQAKREKFLKDYGI